MTNLGLSVSYDRVLNLSTEMGNKVCDLYQSQQLVCPPQLRSNVFTTAAVDNIDHNPSSTTAKDSFHGTAISLHQHPSFVDEGNSRILSELLETEQGSSKTINRLPDCYTNAPPCSWQHQISGGPCK